jgi:GT2 family glycosyltransferase
MNNAPGIAIVIITYNRPADMLELALNIASLEHRDLLKEIIVVNNNSSESYQQVESFIREHTEVPFRYYSLKENLGVSKGRNYAIQQSTAPLLLFIDDDALFRNKDALVNIHNIFTEPANESTGIVAFKVFYHSTGEMQVNAFPHKQFEERKDLHQFDTYYFSGCAHAIRRIVFDTVGYYPENFFYGMEEYDLSYRTLRAGFKIVYDDRVVVMHKESPGGRISNRDKIRGMWVNKTKVAWKFLPKKYFYSTALLWSIEYLKRTGGDLKGWLKGWRQVRCIPRTEQRTPISSKTTDYLEKVEARLSY